MSLLPPPHLQMLLYRLQLSLAIYSLPEAAWCGASWLRAAVLSSFLRVEEMRTHRILLAAALCQLLKKDAWSANLEARRGRW